MAQRTRTGRQGWRPQGPPIAARPQSRPLIGSFSCPAPAPPFAGGSEPCSLRLGAPRAIARGPGPRKVAALSPAVGLGFSVWDRGYTPGAGVSRKKLGNWHEDPRSIQPIALQLELVRVFLPLSFSSIAIVTEVKSAHRLQISGLTKTAATAATFI